MFWGREYDWVQLYPKVNPGNPDYLRSRGEYVVLYTFEKDGTLLNTRYWYAGTSAECDDEFMTFTLQKWIDELGEWEFSDIAVKLFQVDIDGFIFGLVPDEETSFINLQPYSSISFSEPWDGEYDT